MDLLINAASFALIKSGQKTVETRLGNDENLRALAVDDELTIKNRDTDETVTVTITDIKHFVNSAAVAKTIDLKQIGDYGSAAEFLDRMRQFQTEDEERQYGLMALFFTR